jgi:hypothetical protein
MGISRPRISQIFALAEQIQNAPHLRGYLKECRTFKQIERHLKLGTSPLVFKYEEELQNHLETNWDEISLSKEWNLIEGKYDTKEVGMIDLLANHNREAKFLVIELKVTRSSDAAVGQLLRYMGWVKRNLAKDGQSVQGLIITGPLPSSDLQRLTYALSYSRNIKLQIYILHNEKLTLIETAAGH